MGGEIVIIYVWLFWIAVSMLLAVISMFRRRWILAAATIIGCLAAITPHFYRFEANFGTVTLILGTFAVLIILTCLILQKRYIVFGVAIAVTILAAGYISYADTKDIKIDLLPWIISMIWLSLPILTTLAARLLVSTKLIPSIGETR